MVARWDGVARDGKAKGVQNVTGGLEMSKIIPTPSDFSSHGLQHYLGA